MLAMARRTISCKDNAMVYANPTRRGFDVFSLGVATIRVAIFRLSFAKWKYTPPQEVLTC